MYHLAYFRLSATATTTTTEHPWQVVFLLCWCLFSKMRCQTQKSLGQIKVLFLLVADVRRKWKIRFISWRKNYSSGRLHRWGFWTHQEYQIRRPKSLLLQSCAYILFNYSSWIISGFWRPHTNSRHLSRLGHGKDYFWTILKIGRVILQLMAKRNANLI